LPSIRAVIFAWCGSVLGCAAMGLLCPFGTGVSKRAFLDF